LPGRKHLVITDVDDFNKPVDDVDIFYNFEDLLTEIKKHSENADVFIIGGASIYRQFVPFADELILTEIDAEASDADVYFPAFDKAQYERYVIISNEDNGIKYEHVRYVRK
jgi:dihydrofolate reductase